MGVHGCLIKSIVFTLSHIDTDIHIQCLGFPVPSFDTVDSGFYDTNNDDSKTNENSDSDIVVVCGSTCCLFTLDSQMCVSTCIIMLCLDSFPTTATNISIHHSLKGDSNAAGTDSFSSCLSYCTIWCVFALLLVYYYSRSSNNDTSFSLTTSNKYNNHNRIRQQQRHQQQVQ